jgi:hypothetical protein
MQNLTGTWYPAVFDGQPQNSLPSQGIDGTPGWKGRIAISGTEAWLSTKDDMTSANDGWVKVDTIYTPPYVPPQVSQVLLESYESWKSFGMVEGGRNYRARFDYFTTIPVAEASFGIAYINFGDASFSNVELVSSAYLIAAIDSQANFMAVLDGSPLTASEIFAEFTFTANSSFEWAGNCFNGSYGSGNEVIFTVTLTAI